MKNLIYTLFVVCTLISCNGMSEPVESDETEESADISEEAGTDELGDDQDWEDPYRDTSYYGEMESKFNEPQLNDSINYVYWADELKVYDTRDLENVILTVPKGEPIKVNWRTNVYPEEMGFHGQLAEVVYNEQTGYCNDVYLCPYPFPKDGNSSNLINYCLNHLHLIEPPYFVERIGISDYAMEGESQTITYNFEGGIQLISEQAYEYSGDFLRLPKIQVQDALLLANELHWDQLSPLTDYHFPAIGKTVLPSEYEYEDNSVTVEENGTGFVTRIEYMFGEGCANWCEIKWEDNGTIINIGGGC